MNTDTSVGSTGYPPPAYYGNDSAGAGWDAEIGGGSSVRFGVRDGSKQTLTAVLAGGLAGAYLTTVGTLARNWCFSGDPPEDTLPQTILGGLAVVGFAGLACYQYNRREGALDAQSRLYVSQVTQSYQAGFWAGRHHAATQSESDSRSKAHRSSRGGVKGCRRGVER